MEDIILRRYSEVVFKTLCRKVHMPSHQCRPPLSAQSFSK